MRLIRRHVDLVLMLVLGLIFLLFPTLDLTVSGWFYQLPLSFFLTKETPFVFLYELVPAMVHLLEIALPLIILLSFSPLQRYLIAHRKPAVYLALVLLLGPGLLVNEVFKNHWDRARPKQIVEFGGDKIFTAAGVPSDQCEHNCSFVCGHASMGFYFLSFGYLFPRQRRKWLGIGIGLGGLIGLARIAQGAHFMSDVVFSFFAVYFTAKLVYALMGNKGRAIQS
ncbi:phosphatase PAP2 family protein [Nitrosococcus oceani]|uniref:phosphatase PAP2 family protein n=1 Tax=Nitrosococcus oceani TaxID=1229 RepID=UPI0004E97EDA|nr:phosphatase PAP2 family protein [Nitrosococcus oceani]KFI22250.1 phosphoesterase PA-phosphatase [Nitrosococcus oceani]